MLYEHWPETMFLFFVYLIKLAGGAKSSGVFLGKKIPYRGHLERKTLLQTFG